MAESFDPYYTWLGIAPDEQPPDHYRLLGIRRFESNDDVIVNASDQRMAHLRTHQSGKHSKESQRLLNEIAAAQRCLLQPAKKQIYDEQLRGTAQSEHSQSSATTKPLPTTTPSPQSPERSFQSQEPLNLIDPSFDAQISSIPPLASYTPLPSNSPFPLMMVAGGSLLVAIAGLVIVLVWLTPSTSRQVATSSTERTEAPAEVSKQENPALPPSVPYPVQAVAPVPSFPSENPKAAPVSVPPDPMAPATGTFTEEETRAAFTALQGLGLRLPSDPQAVDYVSTANSTFTAEHAPLLAKLPKLSSLNLAEHPDASEILQAVPELPTLRHLDLQQTPVSDNDLRQLRKFSSIRTVNLWGTKIAGPGLQHLRDLKELETVGLSSSMSRDIYPHVSTLVQIKSLGEWPSGMTDTDFDLVTKMRLLRHVDLQQAKVGPASLAKIVRLRELKYLVAPSDLNDEGLRMIAQHSELERLEFMNASQITDSGYRELAKSRTIAELALPSSIRDSGVMELAAMTQLRSLILWQGVTDDCIPALCKLPSLESLTFHGAPISEVGFTRLQEAHALRTLNLYGVRLDDQKLTALARLKQLKQLMIQQEQLTAEQLGTLTRELPGCAVQHSNTGS